VARGPEAADLRVAARHGPYPEDELAARVGEVADHLLEEGFWRGGVLALLERLESALPRLRAHAAVRLGWRRCREAVEPLLELLPRSVDESCSVLDALGMIGDERAVRALREYAARKLLSRRRSAVEALRQLGDEDGLNEARLRARERLPAPLVAALDAAAASEYPLASAPEVAKALQALEPNQQGPALDTLYELGFPVCLAAVRLVRSGLKFAQPHVWRNVKSVFKRSMLRHDYETFGWIAHQIEAQGRNTKGTFASVKSGYDGAQRQLVIFGKNTQNFLRRQAWRYLKDLAFYRPEAYAHAAAEALVPYTPQDVQEAGEGRCYLLHSILYGGGKRFRYDDRTMTFRPRSHKHAKAPPGEREEAYPELWDAQPQAYLRVLTGSALPQAHPFALRGVEEHPQVLADASNAAVIALVGAPYEPTVELGLRELERRFDPDSPDWSLLRQLLADERPLARTLGQRWLRLTAHLWLKDTSLIVDFLAATNPNIKAMVVELTISALHHDPDLRRPLAERIVDMLRTPEPSPGAHDGYAQLVREALVAEANALLTVAELADWIARGAPAVKAMAGHLLRHRPDAVRELGLERLADLAQHEMVAVRQAAHALIRSAVPQFNEDPSLLFVLAESDWEDTRRLAFDILRTRISIEALGLDGLTGLLDSNRPDVQQVGRELAIKHTATLAMPELVFRLVQHPAAAMRRFALELVVQHLPEGPEPLAGLKTFCRSALLDLWPDRKVKRQMVDFLAARGLEDPAQAAVAAAVLGDLVRVQGKADFEHTLQALVRLKLAHPQVPMTVRLVGGGEA